MDCPHAAHGYMNKWLCLRTHVNLSGHLRTEKLLPGPRICCFVRCFSLLLLDMPSILKENMSLLSPPRVLRDVLDSRVSASKLGVFFATLDNPSLSMVGPLTDVATLPISRYHA